MDSKDTSVTYTSLGTTSDKAVAKKDVEKASTYEAEDGDKNGPFDIAAYITKTVQSTGDSEDEDTQSETKTELLVLGSVYMLEDSIDSVVSNSNTQIVTNALKEFVDTNVETISVPVKSVAATTLTITQSGTRLFGILIAVVVPIGVLAAGIVIWIRRRKR